MEAFTGDTGASEYNLSTKKAYTGKGCIELK
jgi:hypothetical protein